MPSNFWRALSALRSRKDIARHLLRQNSAPSLRFRQRIQYRKALFPFLRKYVPARIRP